MKVDKALRRDRKIQQRSGMRIPSSLRQQREAERAREERERKERMLSESIKNLTFEIYSDA